MQRTYRYRYVSTGHDPDTGKNYKNHHACTSEGKTLCGMQREVLTAWETETPIPLGDHWVHGDDFCPKCHDLLVMRADYGVAPSQWERWPQAWLIVKREK